MWAYVPTGIKQFEGFWSYDFLDACSLTTDEDGPVVI